MANRGIYPALSGAMAESRALDAVAENLANASTAAFRAQRLSFRETLSLVTPRSGSSGKAQGDLRYVNTQGPVLDISAGPMRFTGQPTDIGLVGPGFLEVKTTGGSRYTRGGALKRTLDGRLTTTLGQEILGVNDAPIQLPPGELTIGRGGEVMVDKKQVGQLKLVEFNRPQALRSEGAGLLVANAADPARPATKTEILAQHLEGANVNPLRAMTEVLVTSRHYEALHRVIETYREIDTSAAREIAAIS